MRPVIGITTRQPTIETSGGMAKAHVVNEVYGDAVIAAGGTPILLPPVDPADAAEIIARIDGLLLSGGGDVDPVSYGGTQNSENYAIDPYRDAFEFALVHEARRVGMTTLAICRGLQVVNVALGGTLIGDIPSEIGSHDHSVRGPGVVDCHQEVTIAADSRVARTIGATVVCVNSIHHQAVRDPGRGLRTAGWAPDGVVEVIDPTDGWPLLAVQWHPEYLAVKQDSASLALFAGLVRAAAGVGATSS
jgi:putative glutamine amidotransferase